jgi:HEAT repeat protein
MNSRIRPLAAAMLSCLLALAAPVAQATPQAEAMQPASESARRLYWEGHEALEAGRAKEALEHFRALEAQLRKAGEPGVDGAMYWEAYALVGIRQPTQAGQVAEQMLREFPQSPWAGEARKFTAGAGTAGLARLSDLRGIKGPMGSGDETGDQAEQDALAAIDALLATDNPKAVALLQRVLDGKRSDKVKIRALFVMIQLDQAAGEKALDGVLKGAGSSHLKREAVKMLAVGGDASSLDRLETMYRQSPDSGIRSAVLEAWMIGDRPDLLARVAANEPDATLRHQAINLVGATGDGAALEKLYAQLKDVDDKAVVLRAFGVAGDDARLARIARSERDPELLRAALEGLGMSGGKESIAAIVEIYRASADAGVRRGAINGLIIAGDGAAIATLYRGETDRDLKRELMRALSVTDGDEALELIDRQLSGEQ